MLNLLSALIKFESPEMEGAENPTSTIEQESPKKILYAVDDLPNPLLWPLFAIQYVLVVIPGILATAILLADQLGAADLPEIRSELFSLGLFTSGVSTIIQILLGCRLPTLEGMNTLYIVAVAAIVRTSNSETDVKDFASTQNKSNISGTQTLQERMTQVQGNFMLASASQFLLGAFGFTGVLLRFIGPVTLAPTVALIGISLVDAIIPMCEQHWGIAVFSSTLVIIFSLMLGKVNVPLPSFEKKRKFSVVQYPLFRQNAIILAFGISWLFSHILTVTDVLPSNSTTYGHTGRTDVRNSALSTTSWFYLPKPFNFGMPSFGASGYAGMLAVTLVTITELLGGYFAIAEVANVVPPPVHAVNRGIAVDGLCGVLCGIFGNVCGNVPYLTIVGCVSVTKVASRAVYMTAACLLILVGVVGKVGAVFTLIPDPVVGGVTLVMFAMLASIGISLLQHVDLTSTRNLMVIGLCLVLGLKIPDWTAENLDLFKTGNTDLDQVLTVLLTTPMFVTGFVGCLLDNITPGTKEERGITTWRKHTSNSSSSSSYTTGLSIYEFPYLSPLLAKLKCCVYCPISPTFVGSFDLRLCGKTENHQTTNET